MSKYALILLLLTSLFSTVTAQEKTKKKKKTLLSEAQKNIEAQNNMTRDSMVFYFNDWMQGSVWLKNGAIKRDIPLLFDLQHDQLEMMEIETTTLYGGLEMQDTSVNVVEVSEVEKFDITYVDESKPNLVTTSEYHFINVYKYTREGIPATGIYELVEGGSGKLGLLSYPFLLKSAHKYNTFDNDRAKMERNRFTNVHDNNETVFYSYQLKERLYFLSITGEIIPVDTKKKELYKLFIGREEEVKEYIRTLEVPLRSKEGLRRVVAFYNAEN
ncbi:MULTISPECIES: hypothetical protein [Flammeovirga]|uniref:Uncharacterized protein n=1 Tax=Flammeovirga agarivorans TaxID=2726742 RepID=A0A7X8SQR6_9BACT|nr:MULTISPECIES: hypothetical protein [Flammeovirga]NLR94679.1 hypothetical protein [Flammeovirga agarivorans]